MVSIIIASVDPGLLQQVKENIADTIGVPYEIIVFENSNGARGICGIYNEGISKASHDILCFMHEDLAISTKDWGKIVQRVFENNPKLGVIGIAGSTYKSVMPTGWASQGFPESERTNILQSFKHIEYNTIHACVNPFNETLTKVVAVDGVWLCVRKEVCQHVQFDEERFKKFHCYDIDFCLAAGKHYEIAVTYDVLLNHFSEGKFDRQWMEQTLLLFHKWEGELPRSVLPMTEKQIRRIEKQDFKYWVKQMRVFGFAIGEAYKMLHRPRIVKILGPKYYWKYHYTIFAIYYLKKKHKLLRP